MSINASHFPLDGLFFAYFCASYHVKVWQSVLMMKKEEVYITDSVDTQVDTV